MDTNWARSGLGKSPLSNGSSELMIFSQIAILRSDCLTFNTTQNSIVDGHAFYTITLIGVGPTINQNFPVDITPNATIMIRDDESE